MKIAVYKDRISTGRGADGAVRDLCAALAEKDSVTFFTRETEKFSRAFPDSVNVVRLAAEQSLAHDLASVVPEALILAGTNELLELDAAYPATREKPGFPLPVIVQFHTHPAFVLKWKHPLRNRRIRRALKRTQAVQVLLADLEMPLRRLTGYAGNVYTIANAVNAEMRRNPPPPPSTRAPTILYAAALNKMKRPDLAIRALARMADKTACLELCGTGKDDCVRGLERLARRLGVAERVHFRGYENDLASAYARATAVVFPSKMEGFGLVIPEAASFGRRTVVCADCLATRALARQFDGIVAEATPEGLARALTEAIAHPMPRENVAAALANYAPATIAEAWRRALRVIAR